MKNDPTPRPAPPPAFVVRDLVERALAEDLGRGDVTTQACVPVDLEGAAALVAREPLVLAGAFVFEQVFATVDPKVRVEILALDGARLEKGAVAARLRGPAQSILEGERVALNFVQRMSGVATKTRKFVDALPAGGKTRIADTRKTTPGLRALERYAVRCGGGHNHRDDLSSAVLIKDNHIAACGGVRVAIERARAWAPHTSRIECEVDRMEQLREAIDARADVVLLDNFDDATLAEAVAFVAGRAILEVSGGVTLERIPKIAASGIDVISAGGLTHSAAAVDLALDWES
ncbi:carboxylating nicotinate-nucleotide diphosphorylase [Sandaracinus amylolyticus]|uniref:Probable nicotinate-nucleotide pyrophosphorylase [carboxylating] n=1 Tax=Sandaracinus amylolyticus TaxID=927083 RepID=A0A0F6W334_9BACT|nr:carboxylating nicotinate-nucleotide diphosphorylase [Sandaracinus amylolyticus]AKF06180.1 Quinolinate phosphoribosyltransferase [Sandaracinus amylolyticus]